MSEAEAFKALGSFPLVQAAVALLIILGAIYAVFRGTKEKAAPVSANGNGIPQWTMMGPVHDAIGAVHDLAEQSRATNHILDRIETEAKAIAKEQREQTILLEDIRNNQVQRGDINPPPLKRR